MPTRSRGRLPFPPLSSLSHLSSRDTARRKHRMRCPRRLGEDSGADFAREIMRSWIPWYVPIVTQGSAKPCHHYLRAMLPPLGFRWESPGHVTVRIPRIRPATTPMADDYPNQAHILLVQLPRVNLASRPPAGAGVETRCFRRPAILALHAAIERSKRAAALAIVWVRRDVLGGLEPHANRANAMRCSQAGRDQSFRVSDSRFLGG
jgi:hypothetical protein